MTESKFFKTIWRINSILFLVVFLWFLGQAFKETVRPVLRKMEYNNREVLPLDDTLYDAPLETQERFDVLLSDMPAAKGFVTVELESSHHGNGKQSRLGSVIRNIGLYDLNAGTTRWVFPTQAQDISYNSVIIKTAASSTGEAMNIPTGYLIRIHKYNKGEEVWTVAQDGSELQKVLTHVRKPLKLEYFGDNQAALVYDEYGKIYITDFDLDTRKTGQRAIIAPPEQIVSPE